MSRAPDTRFSGPKIRSIHAGTGGFLRYRADRPAVALVALGMALLLAPFLAHPGLPLAAALWTALFGMRVVAICLQHYHGHLHAFRYAPLNIVYGSILALLTGTATAEWELQHNRAHHRDFREPRKDVASSVDHATGRRLGHLEYVLGGSLRIMGDCFAIARAQGGGGWTLRLTLQYAALLAAWGGACAWSAPAGIAFVVIPSLAMRAMVWYGSYWHHLDVPRTSLYDSSVSNLGGLYNRITFNSGHHTAHHEKPTLHWSLLPARTRAIRALIPDACVLGASGSGASRRKSARAQPRNPAAPSASAALAAERIASS